MQSSIALDFLTATEHAAIAVSRWIGKGNGKPPFERTGAGDAFSPTLMVALALGMSIEDALRWAPISSMSVVQYIGAREGLLMREKKMTFTL